MPTPFTARQKAGFAAIQSSWNRHGKPDDPRQLAYVLATAWHETAGRMEPVRETSATNDTSAIARLDRAWASGRLGQVSKPYWRADASGKAWFGRGYVQLTHRENYRRMTKAIRIDLIEDPARALDPLVAADILVIGMRDGLFTGKKLGDAFSATQQDWIGARAIINGTDRAADIAEIARHFFAQDNDISNMKEVSA